MQKFFVLPLILASGLIYGVTEDPQRYSTSEKFDSYNEVVFQSSGKRLICDAKGYNINTISEETDENPADDPVDE